MAAWVVRTAKGAAGGSDKLEYEHVVLALKGLGGSRDRKEQDGPTRTLSVCIGSTVLIDKPL